MNKDIVFSGLSAQPSDYECPDGDLAASLNLINEDGHIKSVASPELKFTLPDNVEEILFIHKTTEFTHYIVKINDNNSVKIGFIEESSLNSYSAFAQDFTGPDLSISHINAIGNTLLVFCNTGIHYYLWTTSAYKYLGDHIPDIDISFGLVGHPRLFSMADDSHAKFTISFAEAIPDSTISATFSEANKVSITSQVMAKVNKFVANESVNKGRFCFPFFVRYALRLFDGSLVAHSAPILMNPSTTTSPIVMWDRLKGKKSSYTEAELDIMLVAATLDYRLAFDSAGDWNKLLNWSDIVKSVDVFISKPIYTFDQDGLCTSFADSDDFESRFIGRLFHKSVNTTTGFLQSTSDPQEDSILGPTSDGSFVNYYAEWRYSHIYAFYFNQQREYPATTLHLPEFSDDKQHESLANNALFYKLCSIDLNSLYNNRTSRTDIKIDDDYLRSLVSREVMTDDYLSHDHLRANSSYVYNNRLNLCGVKRKLFSGFTPAAAFAYVSPCVFSVSFKSDDNNKIIIAKHNDSDANDITVFIKENGRDYLVSAGTWSDYGVNLRSIVDKTTYTFKTYLSGVEVATKESRFPYHWPSFFFYPNVNAYRLGINLNSPGTDKYYIDLKPHEFLNGAFAILDYNNIRNDNSANYPNMPLTPTTSTDAGVVSMPNKVYSSEVNNPFFFPLSGINTVGSGNILRLSTAAKALSQGQFGQFPLYAFTDEGVWAMEISGTGTFSAKQPITRDVCSNPDAITQIDSAVLFPTDRGIMLISGSNTVCISDIINNDSPIVIDPIPSTALFPDSSILDEIAPFSEFIKSCGMLYDYPHQRIIVFNKSFDYAFIYSLKSKLWGMMQANINNSLNSYPNALAVDKQRNVVNFSIDSDQIPTGLLVTRPLKLDAPDILKTVDTVIQRGNFRKGHVQSVLYGSRDLHNWHLVWSSKDHYLRGFRGSPYKYFRIVLFCNLDSDECIFRTSVQFSPRLTNHPR